MHQYVFSFVSRLNVAKFKEKLTQVNKAKQNEIKKMKKLLWGIGIFIWLDFFCLGFDFFCCFLFTFNFIYLEDLLILFSLILQLSN